MIKYFYGDFETLHNLTNNINKYNDFSSKINDQ